MKTIAIILFTIMFGLLLHSQLARAEIYKWVDEKGTVHFTDNPAKIPEKFRNQTTSEKTEEDFMTPEEKFRDRQEKEKRAKESIERNQREYKRLLEQEEQRKAKRWAEDKLLEIQVEREKQIKRQTEEIQKQQREAEEIINSSKKCWNCDGKGWIGKTVTQWGGGWTNIRDTCPICNGTGVVKK